MFGSRSPLPATLTARTPGRGRICYPAKHDSSFVDYTHVAYLRLLTNQAVMGEQTVTLRKAWNVYDR